MKRRSFIRLVGGAAGACTLYPNAARLAEAPPAAPGPDEVAGLPRRVLGRTGQKLSVVGFPGLCLVHYDQPRCDRGVREAFDKGVNYFDVAPAYGDGDAETKMGPALQGLDRSRIFLACKTKMRDQAKAREEMERSLKRLKTDRFDLYQLHHIRTEAEVTQALGPGGAIETLQRARDEGKVRYLGFSAHTTRGALALLKGFRFDTAMFPINFVELLKLDFGRAVLDLAREQGVAVLAIKPMSRGSWPAGVERSRQWWYRSVEETEEVNLAWRFTLSQPGVVAGIPPSFLDLLDKAIEAGKTFRPITAEETGKLRTLAANCGSIFEREEKQVALGPVYPDSPHEGGCCYWASKRRTTSAAG